MDLRQSTASQEISLGQFLDSTDGNTEEAGLTIANTDIKIRKSGTITLANKNSGGATYISNGVYHATLDATDTNTAGELEIYVHVAGALAVKATFNVLTATAYDAKYTGTFYNFDPATDTVANVTAVATTTTNTDMRGTDSANTVTPPTVAELNARTLLAAGYFDPAVDAVANVTLVATTTTNTDMRGTDGANTTTPNTVAPDNASITAILGDTNELQLNQGSWLTATGFSTHSAADVWSVVTRILTANTNLNDPTISAIADGVWDELLAGHAISGSAGEALSAAGTAGDPWVTAIPGAYSAGQAGNILGNLNDFDPAVDVVARVTLNDTTTANIDMRGTDGANTTAPNTVVPDNAGITAILGDTNELQLNQGNWLTAVGFSTHTAANVWAVTTRVLTAFGFTVVTDAASRTASQADVSALATTASLDDLKGATFSTATDSNEAIRDRGDSAWITGGGGAAPTVEQIRIEMDTNSTKLISIDSDTTNLVADDIPGLLGVILDYHDNTTKFFASDGTTETTQSLAFFMVTYADNGTTELKRIGFRDSLDAPVVLTSATRYVKI